MHACAYLEAERRLAEAQVLGRNEAGQKVVDAFAHGKGHRDHAIDTRSAVEAADKVGQIVENGEIVLDDNDLCFGTKMNLEKQI